MVVQVVERVLVGTADLVLTPMDSRRYLEAGGSDFSAAYPCSPFILLLSLPFVAFNSSDHGTKREFSNLYVNNKNFTALHTRTVVPRQPGEYCGLVHNLQQSGFTHAFRPSPVPGKVDAASAFFRVQKYKSDNVKFSKFFSVKD